MDMKTAITESGEQLGYDNLETRIPSSCLREDKSEVDGIKTQGSGVEEGGGVLESLERSTLSRTAYP